MQVLDSTQPKARTEHRCQLCGRTIQRGETYDRQRNVADGRLYAFKSCQHCAAMVTLTDATEYADDGFDAFTIADWQPSTIWEARLKAQWKRKWRRRNGDLYPVPDRALIGGDS